MFSKLDVIALPFDSTPKVSNRYFSKWLHRVVDLERIGMLATLSLAPTLLLNMKSVCFFFEKEMNEKYFI